ncbi:MAG: FKBP-type peptidyl-prolyl cis-trans isomerase [Bacteroidia bacterium]|nr:FKBP-type peptidyl-prolyl cis-trans isomerase [Bacteroidia bacterium]
MIISKYLKPGYLFLGILLLCLGCDKDDNTSNLPPLEEYIATNNLTTEITASGLHYIIDNPGTGRSPGQESTVRFSFVAKLTDGTVFSDSNGEQVYFNTRNFIQGLNEAIQLLKEGGSGIFIIPHELAYGTSGFQNIPGSADIIYEIEMTSVVIPVAFYIQENALSIDTTTASGVKVIIEVEGDGNHPEESSTVEIKYRGYFTDNYSFDSSGSDFVSLSLSQVIPGWREAIPVFSKGGKGKIFIPYTEGYGTTGSGPIPGRTDLIFDIELKDFF